MWASVTILTVGMTIMSLYFIIFINNYIIGRMLLLYTHYISLGSLSFEHNDCYGFKFHVFTLELVLEEPVELCWSLGWFLFPMYAPHPSRGFLFDPMAPIGGVTPRIRPSRSEIPAGENCDRRGAEGCRYFGVHIFSPHLTLTNSDCYWSLPYRDIRNIYWGQL